MRWNCPHCSTNLALSDDKLSPNWSFSRCYQCGGYAMVRRPEINLVKVDRAPDGERVLLPEAHETPLLPREAQDRLNTTQANAAANAALRASMGPSPTNTPAQTASSNPNRRRAVTIPQRPAAWASAGLSAMRDAIKNDASKSTKGTAPAANVEQTPAPVETVAAPQAIETPATSTTAAPEAAAALASAAPAANATNAPAPSAASAAKNAIAELFQRNRTEATPAPVMPANRGPIFPNPLPELVHVSPQRKPRYLPVAIGVAAALAVTSGVYLYIQAQTILERTQPANAHHVTSAETYPAHQAQSQVVMPRPQQATQAANMDRISTNSASADRTAPAAIQAPARQPAAAVAAVNSNPPLLVKPKTRNVSYNAGPGIGYPTIGTVSSAQTYPVLDFNDRWLKVKIGNNTGWVRNDSVLVLINPEKQ